MSRVPSLGPALPLVEQTPRLMSVRRASAPNPNLALPTPCPLGKESEARAVHPLRLGGALAPGLHNVRGWVVLRFPEGEAKSRPFPTFLGLLVPLLAVHPEGERLLCCAPQKIIFAVKSCGRLCNARGGLASLGWGGRPSLAPSVCSTAGALEPPSPLCPLSLISTCTAP